MKRGLLYGVVLLALAVCALPALAASPDPVAQAALAAIFAPAPAVEAPPQAQDAAARGHHLPVKSTCTANCWDGSTVTCSGTTCNAVNSNCAGGQGGYCSGTTSGTINCPPCPPCTATVACSPSGSVSCTSAPGYTDCFGLKNCYVDCGNSLVWCPHHGICPV